MTRSGLLLEEQRRFLWHELVHADRGDEECLTGVSAEQHVERAAALASMPILALEWAASLACDWHEFVGLLKLPEDWVRFRLATGHPATMGIVRKAANSAFDF